MQYVMCLYLLIYLSLQNFVVLINLIVSSLFYLISLWDAIFRKSQKGQGLPQAIHGHIVAGIEEARKDPKALLVFSGGETRSHTGPLTEAQTYYHVADAMNLWPSHYSSSVRSRATTEEFATDSFENL